jgi:signal transduction histidine kinase/CheY-like chemotaxis protein
VFLAADPVPVQAKGEPFSIAERWVLAVGFAVTTTAVVATRVAADTSMVRLWDNVHWTASYATAAVVAYLSSRRAHGSLRLARRFCALGLIALTVGQLMWDVQVAVGWNPFPGPSDGAFVLLGPLLGVGVLMLTRGQSPARRVAIGLDATGIGLVFLALTLAAYLPRRGDFDTFTMTVLVAYPTLMLTVAALYLVVLLELREPPQWSAFLLFAGILGQGVLWAEWNLATLAGELGDALILNYCFSYSALVLGSGVALFEPAGREVTGRVRSLYRGASRLTPLFLVVAAAIAMLLSGGLLPQPRNAVLLCMVGVVIVAAFRQSFMLEEGERLLAAEAQNRALEEKLNRSQRMESLGTLAGGIAHDFNNLLTAMLGHIELLSRVPGLSKDATDSVDGLRAGAKRARDVVRRILAFSRHETTSIEAVDALELVEEVVALLRAALPARHVLSTHCDGRPVLRGSPAQIHQVLMNLGTNASHAIGERAGNVSYRARLVEIGPDDRTLPVGRYVELSVSDDGSGMDAATQARMFDPFFTTKRRGEGTGLGLSVVHSIVLEHKGALRVESTLGTGTTIRVLFPASDQPVAKKPSSNGELKKPSLAKGEVLVVDDEPMIGSTLVRLLTHLGQRAESLTSPDEALALVSRDPNRFSLVVTDMSMPTMTGAELAQALRKVRGDIRVVLSSGTDFVLSGTPFDDVLPKPYTVAALSAMLERNLLSERARAVADALD